LIQLEVISCSKTTGMQRVISEQKRTAQYISLIAHHRITQLSSTRCYSIQRPHRIKLYMCSH